MPSPDPPRADLIADARRAMEVCNACRYCEGFCAVFPAMERCRSFTDADLNYLANLCHGCRGCFYACQYAPPHPFGINVPLSFSELRLDSYAQYAWPKPFAAMFRNNGAVIALAMGFCVALVIGLAAALQDPASLFGAHPVLPGAFYAVIPYAAMLWPAAITFLFSLLALGMGVRAFWRDAGTSRRAPGALVAAIHEATALTNLGGGGHGCNDRDEVFSMARRRLHHAMFYGFVLCFAATGVASIFHHLGDPAPYAFLTAPVLLGTVGGFAMLVGAGGLFWLKLTGDQAPVARRLIGADVAMLTLLTMVALTGLLLLGLRATSAMGTALAVHLGFVLALFVTLPYSRMVHGLYRFAALLRNAIEARTMRVLGE
jgi:citrate/tricarballylate utilization protein